MSATVTLKKEEEVQQNSKRISILFIGNSSTGKTSLVTRVYADKFPEPVTATIGISDHAIGATINGEDYIVRLLDTAGQERFDSVSAQYFRMGRGTMIVYDITNYSSYENVKYWMLQVNKFAPDKASYPVILLGNKADINKNDVHHIDGQKVAEDLGMDGFFRTSAKSGEGINDAIKEMVHLIISRDLQLSNTQNVHVLNTKQEPNKCVC